MNRLVVRQAARGLADHILAIDPEARRRGVVVGYDARLQFLHQSDLFAVLRHAVLTDVAGTYNVAGDGILMLTQAVRRLKRLTVPLPGFAVGAVGSGVTSPAVSPTPA